MEHITTEFTQAVHFVIDDADVSVYTRKDSQIVGTPEILNLTLAEADMKKIMADIDVWTGLIQSGVMGGAPRETILTPGYWHETIWPTAESMKQELSIGDLTCELEIDLIAREYTLSRSAFALSWIDYLWFCARWRGFILSEVL